MKEFDKQAFRKGQNHLAIVLFLIGLIGVASIICGFVLGRGVDGSGSFGKDPMDYYGTYYTVNENYILMEIEIDEEQLTMRQYDVFAEAEQTDVFAYQYADLLYMESQRGEDFPALFIYDPENESVENIENITKVLYLSIDTEGETVLIGKGGNLWTKEVKTAEDVYHMAQEGAVQDCTGTFYAEENFCVCMLDVKDGGEATLTVRSITAQSVTEYHYLCVSAAFAQNRFRISSDYGDCPALLLYENNLQENVQIYWILDDGNGYRLAADKKDVTYTTEVVTFKDIMKDPCNYYGTFTYNANNVLQVNRDGSAVFMFNGQTNTYKYCFVSTAWLYHATQQYFDDGIVLYDDNGTAHYVFELTEDGNFLFSDQYEFVK